MKAFPFLVLALSLAVRCPADDGVIRTANELNGLSDAQAAEKRRFELSGTIVFVSGCPDTNLGQSFVMSVEGTNVSIAIGHPATSPTTGDVIRVAGHSYVDSIMQHQHIADRLAIVGHVQPPPPADITLTALTGTDHDRAFVRVQGTVSDFFPDEIDSRYYYMLIRQGGVTLPIAFPDTGIAERELHGLIGAEVSAVGICWSVAGERRYLGPRLEVAGRDDIRILRPTPQDPFNVAALEHAHHVNPSVLANMGRRRISGRVLATWRGNSLILKTDDGRFMKVELGNRQVLPHYGDHILVAGFPVTDLFRINLTEAIWKLDSGASEPEPAPAPVPPQTMMQQYNGRIQMRPPNFGRSIKVTGTVVSRPANEKDLHRAVLDNNGTQLPVIADSLPDALQDVVPGCVLEVSGICLMETENWRPDSPFPRVTGAAIIPRTEADVRILSRPPWWTPQRLFVVIGSLLAVLLGSLVWIRFLNRLVTKRSRELMREEIAHAEADFRSEERTRLSVELHDTIAQNLTGVSLQLDSIQLAAESNPKLLPKYIETTRLSLQNCRTTLRNCLWDLRSRTLEEKLLSDAIIRTIAPHKESAAVSVSCDIRTQGLSDNSVHAILCIIREAVINAVRHGKASEIGISGTQSTDGRLSFSITDNGCGFDPSRAPGIGEGHFGLQGIRERVHALKGTVQITSSPGHGTTVTLTDLSPEH